MDITWIPGTARHSINAPGAVPLGSDVLEDKYSMIFSKPVTAQ